MIEADLVIIDFDDTLALTNKDVFKLENAVAAEMGHQTISQERFLSNWGKPLDTAVPERFIGIDLDEFKLRRAVILEQMIQTGEVDQVSDANLAALDELLARNKKLAILTSRTIAEARHLLDPNHAISSRIERFYHKDNSSFHKPDPRVFDQILLHFNMPPNRAVYVGDVPNDAKAAKGAGLHFIAVMENRLLVPADFNGLNVDRFVDRFAEIPRVIR